MSKQQHQQAREKLRDPETWRRHTMINIGGNAVLCSQAETDWERADNLALDNGSRLAMGLPPKPGLPTWSRAYLQRGRCGNKTTAGVVRAIGMISGANHKISITWAAGSREQAAIAIDAADTIRRLNSHHRGLYEVQRGLVLNPNTGSELSIISADERLAFGLTLDALFLDELANWPEAHHGFFETLYSGIDKKVNSYMQIGTNAGVIGSAWWKVYETICNSAEWFKSIGTEEQTHLSVEARKRQKAMLLPSQYSRLICNQWVPPLCSAISEEALRECIVDYAYPMRFDQQREAGWAYIGSADLSSVADHSAILLLAVNSTLGKIRVATSKRFVPRGGKVDLLQVSDTMRLLHHQYRPLTWFLDTYESRRLAQEFQRFGARVVVQSLQGTTGAVAAAALVSSITSGQLEINPRCESLIQDIRSLEIIERAGLLRIISDRNRRGHADEAFSLVQAIAGAQELCSRRFVGMPGEMSAGHAARISPKNPVRIKPGRWALLMGVHDPMASRVGRVVQL